MRFNIISNISNGAGLQRDYLIIKGILEAKGHQVCGVMFDGRHQAPAADINIFLEVVTPHMMDAAPENWVVPNPEWWFEEVWDRCLPRFSKVICKTPDCFRIFSKKVGSHRCVLTGFESMDFYQPEVPRKLAFLHMAGKSETKNTAAVVGAWKKYKIQHPLTVVAFKPNIARLCQNIEHVTHIERIADDDLPRMMNEYQFHVTPSKYEGFGHYIHEALGCGGVVITTDAAPMNEFRGVGLLIRSSRGPLMREAQTALVSEGAVAHAVNEAAQLDAQRIAAISSTARAAFLSDREAFRLAFGAIA